MQTFMPLTQATVPPKGTAPESKKPMPEREGEDFDTVFKKDETSARSESQEHAEEVNPADTPETDSGDGSDNQSETAEAAAIEAPLKKAPTDEGKTRFADTQAALVHSRIRRANVPESMQKDTVAPVTRAEPKSTLMPADVSASDNAELGKSLKAAFSAEKDGEVTPIVGPRIEAGPRQNQQATMTHIFGLQLDRGLRVERAFVTKVPVQPEMAQAAKSAPLQSPALQADAFEAAVIVDVEKTARIMGIAPSGGAVRNTKPSAPGGEGKEPPVLPIQDKALQAVRPETKVQAPRVAPTPALPEQTLFLAEEGATVSFDASMDMPADVRLSASPTRFDPMINVSRPEIARHIGTQLVEALPRAVDRPVELSLNPEELGRVRISLNAVDSGITMSVTAERPETIDLMRRHIDQLAQEFRALGYGSISFDFNQQSGAGDLAGDGSDSQPDEENKTGELTDISDAPGRTTALRVASDALDLRL